MVYGIVGFLLILVLIVVLFINLSPQFGGKASKAQKASYQKSKQYKDGVFVNTNEVQLDMSLKDMATSLLGYFKGQANTKPKENINVAKIDSLALANYKGKTRFIWFGHSTFLVQMENKTLLIDPMFGKVPAPLDQLGSERFSKELPIAIEKLPAIDAVLISHDHYDHLDYGSIQALKDKVKHFYTPLGVGVHLEAWGISKTKITELDWWQAHDFYDLKFVCTPAQHFSGRGLTDRTKTLWSSWVIQSSTENIFFSGDSGYAHHFKQIGETYGPFDFAMIECGQYNKMWPEIHMFPEETVQASIDLKAREFMPIHWGAFKLAMHAWTDPIERVSAKAKALKVNLRTPKIGETFFIDDNIDEVISSAWWE